ncbi:DUF3829 domain-containing protein [Pseudomonas sp. 22105]|uniref:DUF3829 domain-containing protein n=1 Tax=Pseudomonas TaxID=286 RepID=UPI000D25B3E2|nr:DUF3829 domain-containing protein [Pseudomonas glycinae]AWA39522.1 hypothetical protein DBV33_13340 [Pseudomonas fluorescens]
MTTRVMFCVGIFFALVIMGLTGATRPFLQLDLWLDGRDAPITAQANALSPVIACINRIDVQWRVAYDRYKHPQPRPPVDERWFASLSDFEDSDALNVRDIQRDVCSQGFTEKLELLAYQPELAQVANEYALALNRVTTTLPPQRFYREASFISSSQQPSAEEKAMIERVSQDYASASTRLRQALLPLDAAQRPEQLRLLEARQGRDVHWYLLAYMIQARETVDVLEAAMKNRTLTPQLLADTTAKLQQAWNRREPFLSSQTSGFQNKTDAARNLWLYIGKPGTEYLDALYTLQKDWRNHAEPKRLSDDFYAINRRYDGLLSYYNRRARAEF